MAKWEVTASVSLEGYKMEQLDIEDGIDGNKKICLDDLNVQFEQMAKDKFGNKFKSIVRIRILPKT